MTRNTRPTPVAASPSRHGRVLCIAAMVCVGTVTFASEPSGLDVFINTVEGTAVRGELLSLDAASGATLRTPTGDQQRIALEDIVQLSTGLRRAPRGRREATFTLTNGDTLLGEVVGTESTSTVVETIDLGRVAVPLETIGRVDTARSLQPAFAESVEWLNRKGAAEEDLVLLTNGDVLRGFIKTIGDDGIAIEGDLGETMIPHRLVVAARFASAAPGASAKTPSTGEKRHSPHLAITLKNSGRLTLSEFEWSGRRLKARLSGGQQVEIESERVVSVDVVGGRWEWLGQHLPISFEHTPMLSLPWEYAIDHNVLGGPITVAGATYKHGVGVHSRTSLTYDLKGQYRTFVTYFGIDDDSGPYADVSVSILVDGRPRHESTVVRRGELFGPVRLDVTKAKRIELIVDFGANGDMQDRFDWVKTALVR